MKMSIKRDPGGNSSDRKNDPKNQANASGELDASGCQGPASGSSFFSRMCPQMRYTKSTILVGGFNPSEKY